MENAACYSRVSKEGDELELVNNFEHPLSELPKSTGSEETWRGPCATTTGIPLAQSSPSCTSINVQNSKNLILNSPKKVNVNQSRRLPFWLWYLIAKSLGIKLKPDERPVLATILYIVTLASGIGFLFSSTWYSVYNIVAVHSGDDVLDGTVSVLVVGFWCALGVYANKLAYRLFGHRKFLAMLRLHSKTVLKLNAAFVVLFLCTAFIVLHNLSSLPYWIGTPCKRVSLDPMVCQLRYCSQVVFSVFSLLWNVLVAVVLVSVCRTHTIGIRRFILELEQDALLMNGEDKDVSSDYEWVDDDYFDELIEGTNEIVPSENMSHQQPKVMERNVTCSQFPDQGEVVKPTGAVENMENPSPLSQITYLANADILNKYWKIMVKLRVSSLALQRWMVSMVSLTTVWATIHMVSWLTHAPQVYEVLNFLVPLLLLPLLCSAYAEVNNEGSQVLKCIRPSEERLMMLQYLKNIPLQLTVFNHAVSYSTIGTAAVGLLLAFVSKILLHEVGKI